MTNKTAIKIIKNLLSIIEDLMPGVKHIVIDIGKLNDGLIEANKFVREHNEASE